MNYNDAIELLKNIVKTSHIPNQKHIDLSVSTAEDRPRYEKALMVVREAVIKEVKTHDETLVDLGIN